MTLDDVSKDCPKLISTPVKLRPSNLAGTFTGSISEEKPIKILEKRERGRIQGLPKFLKYPLQRPISGTGKATDFKFGWYIHTVHRNKSPFKILEKIERRHMQGLLKVFKYLLLSQEPVRTGTSNFVLTLIGSIGTKAH